MATDIQSYRDLKVWQEAMNLAENCYVETRSFPKEEMYGLTSQMRRSAVSIAANIAEGYGRDSTGLYIQFLRVAQGSLKELETLVILALRIALWSEDRARPLLDQCDSLGRMLRALIKSVSAASKGSNKP